MSKEEMLEIVRSQTPQWRLEGMHIPQGLSLTRTYRSEYYYYREGNLIYLLRLRRDEEPFFEIINA